MNLLSKEKKYHFTYQTKNLVNGKTYVGVHSTNNILDGYLGSGDKLFFSIKKYGRSNFKLEILDFFDTKEDALKEEAFLVDAKWVSDRNNYNMTLGGYMPPSWIGKKVSDETKAKISKKNTGKIRSEQAKIKIGNAARGRYVTPETRAKLSLSSKGKNTFKRTPEHIAKIVASRIKSGGYTFTDEQRKKISQANIGRKVKPETTAKRVLTRRENQVKNIVVKDRISGNILGMFYSCDEASAFSGMGINGIVRRIRGAAKYQPSEIYTFERI